MTRHMADLAASCSADPIQHIQDFLGRRTNEVKNRDGLVLELDRLDRPRVTGWVRSNSTSEFLAFVPRIIRCALSNSDGRQIPQPNTSPPGTWEHSHFGTGDHAAGELWVYRRHGLRDDVGSVGSTSGSSAAMKRVLDHIT